MKGILIPAVCMLALLPLLPCRATGSEVPGYVEVTAPGNRTIRLHVPKGIDLGTERSDSHGEELRELLVSDLELSGLFTITPPSTPLEVTGIRGEELDRERLAGSGIDMILLVGYRIDGGSVMVEGRLYDIFKGQDAVAVRFVGAVGDIRHLGHRISDEILRVLTGTRGVFSRRIAFVSAMNGSKEIHLSDMDGRNPLRITSNGSINLYPDFSPDGRRILYTSYRQGGPHLFVRELSSGSETRLTKGGTNIGGSWSPDGKEIIFSASGEGDTDIFRIDPTGEGKKNLTRATGIDVSPSFSPDGSRIVFVSDRLGKPQLFVMNRDGSDQRRLTSGNTYSVSPRWSPKGDRIVFSRQTESGFQIFTISPDGSNEVQLTFEGNNEHPRWSPDGRFIVFTSTRGGVQGIAVMRSDGSGRRHLIVTRGKSSHPVWEP